MFRMTLNVAKFAFNVAITTAAIVAVTEVAIEGAKFAANQITKN